MRTIVYGLFSLTLAVAQDHGAGSERPVTLYAGLGTWRHPIHTGNAEAQKYFDQGLALLYGFNRYEALRSFRKAARRRSIPRLLWPIGA